MKILMAFAVILASIAIAPAQADVTLKFGVYTSDKPTTMVKMFRPVLNALEAKLTEKLGEPTRISLQVAATYDQGIDDLVAGRVNFARMGPASYVVSKDRNPDLQLLAMESKDGEQERQQDFLRHYQRPPAKSHPGDR
jgi:phosphonate transport system substrate-binding protein